MGVIRARLASFDAAFTAAYGDGARVRPTGHQAQVGRAFRELEQDVKHTFDEEEHALYAALGHTLDVRTGDQLLIVILSGVALLVAALLAVFIGRAIRGRFARAYGMLDRSEERLHRLVEQLPAVVYALALDEDTGSATPVYVSPRIESMLGVTVETALHDHAQMAEHVPAEDRERIAAAIAHAVAGGTPEPTEFRFQRADGREVWLRDSGAASTDGPDGRQLQGLLFDITAEKDAEVEHHRMELELRLAQKLEAVGQLAAGIAHEINTPVQFVGDTVGFLQGAFDALLKLGAIQDELHRAASAGDVTPALLERVSEAEDTADVEYLRERVPAAFVRARDGIDRVGAIVGAMREFAHPPTIEQNAVDLNQALRNTLIVAANEYKYVADVETDFDELPPVRCNDGDINQVFLNLIVNAAHAIEEQLDGSRGRGLIRVRTRAEGDHVLISIGDTGCGIPSDVAGRIFDPFFTTKDVGRGTGQGLAISRTLVVERHGGQLTFETEQGSGTTFHVRLPIGAHPAAADTDRAIA
jgi:PAS domain S-box-containing protein